MGQEKKSKVAYDLRAVFGAVVGAGVVLYAHELVEPYDHLNTWLREQGAQGYEHIASANEWGTKFGFAMLGGSVGTVAANAKSHIKNARDFLLG